jgi:Copine
VAAIDLTGTNGEASTMLSMIVGPDQQKKKETCARVYSSAIHEIGSIMETYDSDGQFALYGFKESQVFALNGDENPYVHGVQGMVNAFTNSLDSVSLSGKTYLAPIIFKAAEIAAQRPPPGHPNQKYVGLIILTDGCVKDKKEVVEAMATISNHAMSIIIVVVGDDPHGTNIKEFETLKNNCRVNTTRDMIQIVQLHAISELSQVAKSFTIARQMIKELPSQLVTYYTSLDIMPIHNSTDPPTKFGNINLLSM